jgi:hypothetical protein
LSVREDFPSADRLSNDWALIGSPGVDDGLILDGTNYARRNLVGSEFDSDKISTTVEFWPEFGTGENVIRRIYNTNGDDFVAGKWNNAAGNVLKIRMRDTSFDIPESTYGPYWVVGGRNTLVVFGEPGDTSAVLNGHLILDGATAVWGNKVTQSELYVGARDLGTNLFLGTIKEVKVFKQKLTQQEAIDYHNNETYCWRSKAVVDLPMLQAQHEPPLTLDVSGGGYNGTLIGVTKLDRRGYQTGGSGNIRTAANVLSVSPKISFGFLVCVEKNGASQVIGAFENPNLSEISCIMQYIGGVDSIAFFSGGSGGANAAIGSAPGGFFSVIGQYDGVDTSICINGISGANAPSPLPPLPSDSMVVSLFSRGDTITTPASDGTKILSGFMLQDALTPTQVYDAHHQMRTQARMI